ncbi:beta-1,4-galactosyltransferase 2 [Phthorimaea operculella]|nr:beta-1,4-galactosyltransferase 2 [Phthorimaea operculella]
MFRFGFLYNLKLRKGLSRKVIIVAFIVIILIVCLRRTDDCEYDAKVNDEKSLSPALVYEDLDENHTIKEGGEYAPETCRPKYSTAVIVPYRNKASLLRELIVYLHIFLRQQQIHYRIYIVEQVDSKPFNRAKLINIGAKAAMKAGYPCLILHDVDLLPLRPANLYACAVMPRHMASNVHKFSFLFPFKSLFGGVVGLTAKQFKSVNGMSNEFSGYPGEDDDFYIRLVSNHLNVVRFDAFISKYHVVQHTTPEKTGYDEERSRRRLKLAEQRMNSDGLNSLVYSEFATVLHPLFTHIMVDV